MSLGNVDAPISSSGPGAAGRRHCTWAAHDNLEAAMVLMEAAPSWPKEPAICEPFPGVRHLHGFARRDSKQGRV